MALAAGLARYRSHDSGGSRCQRFIHVWRKPKAWLRQEPCLSQLSCKDVEAFRVSHNFLTVGWFPQLRLASPWMSHEPVAGSKAVLEGCKVRLYWNEVRLAMWTHGQDMSGFLE